MSEGPHRTHHRRFGWLVLAVALVCPGLTLLTPAVAYAADEQEYDLIKTLVSETQHEQAAARCARLLDPASPVCPNTPDLSPQGCRVTDPTIVRLVRGYYAIALQSTGKNEAAKDQFRAILKDNPTFTPSPAIYPIKSIDLFNEVKREGQAAEIERIRKQQAALEAARETQRKYDAYVTELERRASQEERVVERSRWFAAVPFGVGQFYNGDVGLGVLFASVEVSAIAAAITTGVIHADQASSATDVDFHDFLPPGAQKPKFDPVSKSALATQLEQLQIANNVSMGVLALALIAGFIEAQASFEPEEVRRVPRALPPKPPKPAPPSVQVSGVPGAPDATGLGLRITF